MVGALVIGKTVSLEFLLGIKLNDNLVVAGSDVLTVSLGHKPGAMNGLVAENVTVANRLPDSPNDARQVFSMASGKDASPGDFRQFLHVVGASPLGRADVVVLRQVE